MIRPKSRRSPKVDKQKKVEQKIPEPFVKNIFIHEEDFRDVGETALYFSMESIIPDS